MPNLLSPLTKGDQARLLEELNYMNLEEGFVKSRANNPALSGATGAPT